MNFGEALILALLDFPRVGPTTIKNILAKLGCPSASNDDYLTKIVENLRTKVSQLSISELKDKLNQWSSWIEEQESKGVSCVGFWNSSFPSSLRNIPDPPILLYAIGSVEALSKPAVAIIGTRCPTNFGARSARRIASRLASQGLTIVSGLAEGCDTQGHEGCLDAGGVTVAVLAHGFGKIYPVANTHLAERIVQSGGVLISEYPPGTPAMRGSFVKRDRLQSGLSKLIIVVETDIKGGTMHTVGFAHAQKKVVAAIDHPTMWHEFEKTRGNQYLIAKGEAIAIADQNQLKQLIADVFKIEMLES